jgi:hypothetical protein
VWIRVMEILGGDLAKETATKDKNQTTEKTCDG